MSKLVDVTGATQVLGALVGTSKVLGKTIKLLKPDLGERLKEKIQLSGYVRYDVPENHRVTRAFRSAWALATVSALDTATASARDGGMPSAAKVELDRVCALAREAAEAVSLTLTTDNTLPEIPIDRHIPLILNMVSDHMLRQTRPDERDLINLEFTAWLDSKVGQHGDPLPPLLTSVIDGDGAADHAAGRNFAYLLVDKIAHIMRNPQLYPDDANSLLIAVERLEHRTIEATLGQILEEVRGGDDAQELQSVRTQLEADREELDRDMREIKDGVGSIVDDMRGVVEGLDRLSDKVAGLAPDFNQARRSFGFLEGMPNLVICADQSETAWTEDFERAVGAAMERLPENYDLGVQCWRLGTGEVERTFQSARMWKQVLHCDAAPHGGTVALIGGALDAPIRSDTTFEDRLAEHGCLASPQAPTGLFFAEAYDAHQRLAFRKEGAVPVTVLTRLIVETHLSGRTLQVLDGGEALKRDTWTQNLVAWLEDLGVPITRDISQDRSAFLATQLLNRILDVPAEVVSNPYLRLEHYVPEDVDRYFGRDGAIAQVLALFEPLQKGGQATVLRIDGASGVGKSSFMNVRVAQMAADLGFDYVTFRPTDIMLHRSGSQRPIEAFCRHVASELGWAAPDETFPLIGCPDLDRAATQAQKWFRSQLGEDRKVLIAIDQFEEIVDSIANDWNGEAWRSVIALAEELVGPRVALAFTLESSRRDIFAASMPDGAYTRAFRLDLDDDPDFLRAVIERPFAAEGFRLQDRTVDMLLEEAQKYGTSAGETISALPLLTLKLHALFQNVARRFSRGDRTRMLDMIEVPHEDIPIGLDIGSEIDSLGWSAWNKKPGTDSDFDAFMRPFVRVVKTRNDEVARLVLTTVPHRGFHAVQARQSAFEQSRLIVPAPGGSRLAHEAIIRRWGKARDWFDKVRESLEQETDFLERAQEWDLSERPKVGRADKSDVVIAARILGNRTADWATVDSQVLDSRTKSERAFCLEHMGLATDPRQAVEGSPFGSCLVHLASSYDQLDLMRRFLEADPDVIDLPRTDGRTPLMTAAFVADDMVALLLEKGANPNVLDYSGWTIIDSAIWGQQDEIFDRLIHVVRPDVLGAVGKSDSEEELQPGVNALYSAASMRRPDLMHRLEGAGWRHDQPTRLDTTPLMGAVYSGRLDILRHCLSRGGEPGRRPNRDLNAFDRAAALGDVDILKELISHPEGPACIDAVSEHGVTPLMRAAFAHRPDAIALLLAAEAQVNAVIEGGKSAVGGNALHCALDWIGRFKGKATRFIVEPTCLTVEALLIAEDLDVNLVAKDGRSPWAMAQHHDSIRTLIENHPRFDIGSLPGGSKSPLHLAVEKGDADKIRALIETGPFRALVGQTVGNVSPAEGMVRLGLGDLVLELLDSGELNPWSADGGNIFDDAWFIGDQRLIKKILDLLPDRLSAPEIIAVLTTAIAGNASGTLFPTRMPDAALIETCIARADGQATLDAALLRVGQLGAVDLFRKLRAAGADATATDDWGRTVLERSSDAVILAEGGATDGWPMADDGPPIIHITSDERATLAKGDLEAITTLIESWGEDHRRDAWGRSAADLVPDVIRPAIAELIEGHDERQ
ncbi:MAG: ankyrin repeat domain-containing protein [Jannaschia sp.]